VNFLYWFGSKLILERKSRKDRKANRNLQCFCFSVLYCSAAESIRSLVKDFAEDTLGPGVPVNDGNDDVELFTSYAENITGGIGNAIFVDCKIDIEASFGLNLDDVFDTSTSDSLPDPFLRINEFDVSGQFGLKEWSDSVPIPAVDMTFGVTVRPPLE